jgi:hypothetical protein
MKSIKCPLLLAAVLAFAVMNAAAMNNQPPPPLPPHIRELVDDASRAVAAGTQHARNWALRQLLTLTLEAIHGDVPPKENMALAGLAIVVDGASDRQNRHNSPDQYVPRPGAVEDVTGCSNSSHRGFFSCFNCCIALGYNKSQRLIARMPVYMDYRGLCSCALFNGAPPSAKLYRESLEDLLGQVIDP